MNKKQFIILVGFFVISIVLPESKTLGLFTITRVQYGGGGDWYSDPSSLPNLLKYIEKNTNIQVDINEKRGKIGDDVFNSSPYLYLTGHGNIRFNDDEIIQLRQHLLNGSFLHADDNYGMDKSFRREILKVFPDKEWIEIPPTHDLFNIFFTFPNGLPKIHEHDNKRPQALGIFDKDRLMVLYTYESDLGDGWEDSDVHSNPDNIRQFALKMGTNIIIYSMVQ